MYGKLESGTTIEDDFCFNNNVEKASVYIRMGFIRKVYGILSIQLLLTTAISAIMIYFKEPVQLFLHSSPFIIFLLIGASFISLFAMYYKKNESPMNLITLFVFTLCESFLVGCVVVHHSLAAVLQALVLTTLVVSSLTMYAMQTKRDFSAMGGCLFSLLFILIGAGMINLFLQSSLLETGIAAVGSAVFSFFIVIDTQAIMRRISPEEYIVACIDLYLDIINLFLHLLRLIEAARQN